MHERDTKTCKFNQQIGSVEYVSGGGLRLLGSSAAAALRPLASALLAATEAAAESEEASPSVAGEWLCRCDYFCNGRLVDLTMVLEGNGGRYTVERETHSLSNIRVRRQGSLSRVAFQWSNENGSRGRGEWVLSRGGDCIDGTWTEDGVDGGPWVWSGVRRDSEVFGEGVLDAKRQAGAVAGAAAASAVAEVLRTVSTLSAEELGAPRKVSSSLAPCSAPAERRAKCPLERCSATSLVGSKGQNSCVPRSARSWPRPGTAPHPARRAAPGQMALTRDSGDEQRAVEPIPRADRGLVGQPRPLLANSTEPRGPQPPRMPSCR